MRLSEDVQIQEIDERHHLAQQLFVRRERHSWTQEELAERAEITQSQVAKLEAGHVNPTLRTLVRLAHALKCSVGEMFASLAVREAQAWSDWTGAKSHAHCLTSLVLHLESLIDSEPANDMTWVNFDRALAHSGVPIQRDLYETRFDLSFDVSFDPLDVEEEGETDCAWQVA